jgi:hypothetical protein
MIFLLIAIVLILLLINLSDKLKVTKRMIYASIAFISAFILLRMGLPQLALIIFLLAIFFLYKDSLISKVNKKKVKSYIKGKMTIEEAEDILGLKPGYTQEDVKSAYQKMMLKNHPDHGGSDYLASKINEAKDVLLKSLQENL